MWVLKIILFVVVVYVALIAVMYATQTRMLFPTYLMSASDLGLPPTARTLEVATPDGERLHGVYMPAAQAHGEDAQLLLLGFGGNAWSANSVAGYLHALFPHADVAAFHYRGYRPSTGSPSAAALLADAPIIYDHLQSTLGTRRVVGVGLSIGAGVAGRARKPAATCRSHPRKPVRFPRGAGARSLPVGASELASTPQDSDRRFRARA